MTNEEKIIKLEELRATIEDLYFYIDEAEILEDNGKKIVAMSEILLMKAYDLYPDIFRVFK